ncbi:MAG: hypothetical protein K2H01_01695, partial [Ruminococcus sp.]|nr:hypothetical protein [Ruminococcus sp.]
NINGEKINIAVMSANGWIGNTNVTIDQCFSNDSNSITLKYDLKSENNLNNIFKTVNYEYDESTNKFVEAGSKSDTSDFNINNYIGTYNATLNEYTYEMKISLGSNEVLFSITRDANLPGGWIMSSSEYNTSTVSYYNGMLRTFALDESGNVLPGNGATVYLNGTGNFVFNSDGTVTWNSDNDDFTPITFSKAITTPDEKTFTVEIPYTYFIVSPDLSNSPAPDEFDGDYRKSMAVNATKITYCSNGTVKSVNGGCTVCDDSEYVTSITVENVKPGKLEIKGTSAEARSSDEPLWSHKNAGYYVGQNRYTFEVVVTIDENGNIVTGSTGGSTDNNNSGTIGGTTGGTANSPSTADAMAIPAAAGSAVIVLGAVFYVYKKRR